MSARLRSTAFTWGEEKHDGEVFEHFTHFFVVLRLSENIVEWGRCHQHFCFSLLLCNIYLGWRSCNVTEAFQITRVFTLNWDFYAFLNPQLALLCLSKTSHLTSLCPEGARNLQKQFGIRAIWLICFSPLQALTSFPSHNSPPIPVIVRVGNRGSFPCCVLLALSWNMTNEDPSTEKLSWAIN